MNKKNASFTPKISELQDKNTSTAFAEKWNMQICWGFFYSIYKTE